MRLLSEENLIISPEVSAMLNDISLVCSKENMDDDSFVDDIEMDNIEGLSTSTCSLESCALEYFVRYIAKKCIDKSQCRKCRDTFLSSNNIFT